MAENTMERENSNKYIGDLKVFEDLLLMSDEEIEKERKSLIDIRKLLEVREEKNREKIELEAFFEELDKKEVITGIERLQRIEKEKRYNQILESETPKHKEVEEVITSGKYRSELERYMVFFKVKEPLSVAEKMIIDARNSKAVKLREARREFKEAQEKDNIALFNINRKLEEIDKYFEDFFKKEYTTEEEQKEFEEKRQSQKELLEAKINFPSQATINARNNAENIRRNAEEHEIIDIARQKIKFMTDRSNWNQILTMSKEELMDFVNGKETSKPEQVQPTTQDLEQAQVQETEEEQGREDQGQEGEEAKAETKESEGQENAETKADGNEQGKQEKAEKDKKEAGAKTVGAVRTGEAPVASDENSESEEELDENENEEGEPKELTDPKRSLWESFKSLFSRNKEKTKVRKPKRQKMTRKIRKERQDKIYKKYIENYKTMYKQEPGLLDKAMAKFAPNFFAQVRNVIEYKEPINPEDYKGTQAEELAVKVDEIGQELERVEGEIVNEDEQSETRYEGTQAQELAEKVAASKRLGENSWDRTFGYIKQMDNVGQMLDNESNLQTIDEYYEQKSNPNYQAPEQKSAEQEEQAVDSRQSVVSKWKKQYEVRPPQDLKKAGIATFGLRGSKDKKMSKKQFNSIMEGINRAGEAKGREARGEAPEPTTPSHGDEGR